MIFLEFRGVPASFVVVRAKFAPLLQLCSINDANIRRIDIEKQRSHRISALAFSSA